MRNYFFSKLLLLSFLSLLISCDNDDDTIVDTTPPTIKDYSINDKTENVVVAPGTEMHFDAVFEDNMELREFKLDIHDNFEAHNHGRLKSAPWEFEQRYDLSGKSETVHKDMIVPEDATSGNYHLTVRFLDAAGNEGEVLTLSFDVQDVSSQPAMSITSPDLTQEVEVAPGESFQLEGTVEDPDGLEEVHIFVAHEDEQSHGRLGEEEPLYEAEYELDGVTSWNFSASDVIAIPADAEPGHYELVITAVDVNGNSIVKTAELHVE